MLHFFLGMIVLFGSTASAQFYPWDDDYDPAATTTTTTTTTAPTTSEQTNRPSYQDDGFFPWDEDYSDSDTTRPPIQTVPSQRPTSTSRPTTTTRAPVTQIEADDVFPWEEDYTEPSTITRPTIATRPPLTHSPPPPTLATRPPLTHDPTLSTRPPLTHNPSLTPVVTQVPTTTTVVTTEKPSGPFPWESDYPDPSGGATVTPPTWDEYDYDGPGWVTTTTTRRPGQTSRPGRPGRPTTAPESAATLLYFPGEMRPIISGNLNASLQANIPCNEGSVLERLQCLSQLLMSFG